MASGINWDDIPEEEKKSSGINWDDISDTPEQEGDSSVFKRALYGLADPAVGAAQLIGKGVEKVLGDNQFSENIRDYYSDYGEDVVDSDGGVDWVRAGGSMVNPITWVGPGKFGKAAKGAEYVLKRALGHGAVGAGQTALVPGATDSDDLALGALIGTGGAGVGKVAGKGYDLLKRNFTGAEGVAQNYLRDLFGTENTSEVANILRNLEPNIQGEQPTAAWGAIEQQGRFPQLASLEQKARRGETAGQFNIRDAENRAAMLRQMDEVIGEGEDVFDASGRRIDTPIERRAREEVGPLYDAASGDRIYMPEAKGRAIDAAADERVLMQQELNRQAGFSRDLPVGGATPTRQVRQPRPDIMDPSMSGQNLDQPFSILPTDTIGSLQAKRQALDATLKAGKDATDAATLANLRNLRNVRSGMTDWMKGASPAFAQAEREFIEKITPQNRADFMKILRGEFNPEEGSGSRALIRAIDNSTRTAERAGIPLRADSVTQAMNPNVAGGQEAIDAVNALRGSARRTADVENITSTELGQPTTIGDAVESFVPPLIDPKIALGRRLAKKLGAATDEEMWSILNEATLNPQQLADLLEAVPLERRNKIINFIRDNQEIGQSARSMAGRESAREE